MEMTVTVDYYHNIINSNSKEELEELNDRIQSDILGGKITDSMEMMILNLAIQTRTNFLFSQELSITGGNTTIMIVDKDSFDPEQMQLDELKEEELEDVKNGNVVTMKDFKRKK